MWWAHVFAQISTETYNLRRAAPLVKTTLWADMGEVMNEITSLSANQLAVQAPETMPHSIEAEQQLLGAILTNNDVYDRVASVIGPKHFYEPVHARIFDIAAQRNQNNASGAITLVIAGF